MAGGGSPKTEKTEKTDQHIIQPPLGHSPATATASAAATLNAIPLQWKAGPPPESKIHCVGLRASSNLHDDGSDNDDSVDDDSWMFRSCEYENLCVDLDSHEYVVFINDNDSDNNDESADDDDDDGDGDLVALGPLNPRWNVGRGFDRGWHKVKWRPTRKRERRSAAASENTDDYYYKYSSHFQLPDTTTLLPLHSMAGHNVGHLAWDDLFAVYKLWRQFAVVDNNNNNNRNNPHDMFLVRHQINDTLYANCDIRRNKRLQCRANFERFVPLLGVNPKTFSTTKQLRLQLLLNNNSTATTTTTSLVCARRALTGTGLLQDHGFRDHGWDVPPAAAAAVDDNDNNSNHNATAPFLTVPHNLGAGRSFFEYAQFLRRHALANDDPQTTEQSASSSVLGQPPTITFSLRSSRDWMRRQNFTAQIAALRHEYGNNDNDESLLKIQALDLRELSLAEQVRLASSTSIFVTTCGGGAVTATFLPRHATLVVFYDARGGLDFERLSNNGRPARLDWDLLNHAAAAHLRVHWLPVNTMDDPVDVELFVRLVRHEVAILRRLREDSEDAKEEND